MDFTQAYLKKSGQSGSVHEPAGNRIRTPVRIRIRTSMQYRIQNPVLIIALCVFTFSIAISDKVVLFLNFAYMGYFTIVFLFLKGYLGGSYRILPEAKRFFLFSIWVMFAGLTVSTDYQLLFKGLERLFQVSILVASVSAITARMKTLKYGFGALFFTALIVGVYGIWSGDFSEAVQGNQSDFSFTGFRSTSLMKNPNSLGGIAMYGFFALTFFIRFTDRKWLKNLCIAAIPVVLISLIVSGSRKALILPSLYIPLFLIFTYRTRMLKKGFGLFSIVIYGILIVYGMPWLIENTLSGQRLQNALSEEDRERSAQTRIEMYREGLEIIMKNPFLGVGLYQWRFYGTSDYSHNEYTEIFATTGMTGGVLYFFPFVSAIGRLRRIMRSRIATRYHPSAGICISIMIILFFAGFAQVHFPGMVFWILISTIWGFAYGVEKWIRSQLPSSTGGVRPPRLIRSG